MYNKHTDDHPRSEPGQSSLCKRSEENKAREFPLGDGKLRAKLSEALLRTFEDSDLMGGLFILRQPGVNLVDG